LRKTLRKTSGVVRLENLVVVVFSLDDHLSPIIHLAESLLKDFCSD
jgi:hypothetical protein